jgi:hypothetical protein
MDIVIPFGGIGPPTLISSLDNNEKKLFVVSKES